MPMDHLNESSLGVGHLVSDILHSKHLSKNPWLTSVASASFWLHFLASFLTLLLDAWVIYWLQKLLQLYGFQSRTSSSEVTLSDTLNSHPFYQCFMVDFDFSVGTESKKLLQELINSHSIDILPKKTFSLGPGLSSSPPFCPTQYHAGCTPAEKHVSEAECTAASIWPGMGTYAAALHCAAASPSEQHRVTRADPRTQSAVRQGPDRGEPECTGWPTGNLYGWLW